MFEEFGNLGLSREQFREILLNYVLAMHIRRRAAIIRNEEIPHLEDLERHLLAFAAGFEADDMVDRTDDGLYPSESLDSLCHELLEARDTEDFWERLEEELAWRDYLKDLPPVKRLLLNREENDPPEKYYKKYAKELEQYGADRLTIDEKQPPLQ